MKWTYQIPQKIKTATLLFGVMVLVIVSNLIARKNISEMNRSVTSIYNDRLIPATNIFYLSDSLYRKRIAMEEFLADDGTKAAVLKTQFAKHDQTIDRLISDFEKTYLVDLESVYLAEFKERAHHYAALEQKVLSLSSGNRKAEARSLYESDGKASFENSITHLTELTQVQSVVGRRLVDQTKNILAISNLLNSLLIALNIVIGIMIISLVSASKIMMPKGINQDVSLN